MAFEHAAPSVPDDTGAGRAGLRGGALGRSEPELRGARLPPAPARGPCRCTCGARRVGSWNRSGRARRGGGPERLRGPELQPRGLKRRKAALGVPEAAFTDVLRRRGGDHTGLALGLPLQEGARGAAIEPRILRERALDTDRKLDLAELSTRVARGGWAADEREPTLRRERSEVFAMGVQGRYPFTGSADVGLFRRPLTLSDQSS